MSHAHTPTMKKWGEAWMRKDEAALADLYTETSCVIPANHQALLGAEAIVNFFKGGMGTIVVTFNSEQQIISGDLAYEFGLVKDYRLETNELFEMTHYSVTWVLTDGEWKIAFHTWSIAIEEA